MGRWAGWPHPIPADIDALAVRIAEVRAEALRETDAEHKAWLLEHLEGLRATATAEREATHGREA